MKIAIFHELHSGGARKAVNEIANQLKKVHTVDLYTTNEKIDKDEDRFFSKIISYPFFSKKWSGKDWKIKLYKDTVELYRLYLLHKNIAVKINDEKYDFVFVHPSQFTQAPFILRFLKQKKIYYCEEPLRLAYDSTLKLNANISSFKKTYEAMNRWIRKKIDRSNIHHADLILANSKNTQHNIASAYNMKSLVSYLGVNESIFKPKKIKKDIDILYIGAKDSIDGYDLMQTIINILKNKPIVKYHIPGENWLKNEKDLVRLYQRSKIVVCLAKNEPFGLIPLEAMACGVPVVAVNDGGYRETVIDGKTGYLVLRDPKLIAKKIKFLLSHSQTLISFGNNARDHIMKNWTWWKSVKNLETLLKEQQVIKSKKTVNKIFVVFGIFIFSMLFRLWTLNNMGRTWDEFLYVEEGYKMIELFKKGDFDNKYFYTTYDHPPLVKYLYGLSAHLDVEKQLPNGEVKLKYDLTYSRLLSAVVFSLGVVVVTVIGWETISVTVGIIAGIILAMLPFTLGLSQLVTTESFKIFIYPLAIYVYILFLKKCSLKKLVLAGVITGIALQIKQSNALLMLIFGLMSIFYYKELKQKLKKIYSKKLLYLFFLIGAISILVFIIIWPQVIFHFSDVAAINKKLWHVQFSPYLWQITLSPPEVFLGRLMLTPTFYYIVYFFISIPILIIGLFFLGINEIRRRKNWIYYTFLLWFLVPFIMSVYSWRQHGLRYIIEIYPAIALIAAVGFNAIISKYMTKERTKILLFIPVIFYLFITLFSIKPYYLDYFNEFVGGTNTVYNHRWFQQGWWGQGEREAGLYLRDNAPAGSTVGLAMSPDHVMPRFEKFKYSNWQQTKKYDYVVVNYYHIIRDRFNDEMIRKNYKLIYQVRADRSTLVFIYKAK